MIRAVFFDVRNTLLYGPVGAELLVEVLAMEQIETTPEEVGEALLKQPGELLQFSRALRTDEDESAYAAQLLAYLTRALGKDVNNAVLNRLVEHLYNYSAFWSMYPETLPVLEELKKRGIMMGVVSNWQMPSLPRFLADFELDPYITVMVRAEEVGAPKPHPAPFAEALKLAGVSAEEALHVGDGVIEDVEGAIAAGIRPVWLNRENSPLAPEVLTITDLRGLLMLVGGGVQS